MHPTLVDLEIGEWALHLGAYSTMLVLAGIVGLAATTLVAGRLGLPRRRVLVLFAGVLAAGVVGARLFHAVTNLQLYAAEPARLWALDATGFALYGGLVTGALAGVGLAGGMRLPAWRLADAAAVGMGLGIAINRVGCFLQGCCYGRPTTLPWGVVFPTGSPAWARQMVEGDPNVGGDGLLANLLGTGSALSNHPVQPTQLYELLAALAAVGLVVFMLRRNAPAGTPFLGAALWFTAFRMANAQLRWTPTTLTAPDWFYPAFYLTLLTLFAGLLAWRLIRAPIRTQDHALPAATAGRPAPSA